jgi:hypothetical protein
MPTSMKKDNSFERQLFSITTIIESSITKDGKIYSSQGSGFYYNEVSPSDPNKSGPQWYSLDKFWLVTNRHVVLPKMMGWNVFLINLIFLLGKILMDLLNGNL